MSYRVFTSESVSEGHPDKLADQISDAVLDAALKVSPQARVGCEVLLKSNVIIVAGEITQEVKQQLDIPAIARGVIAQVGYDDQEHGMDYRTCQVQDLISEQEVEINQKVDLAGEKVGAGDQGMMFGYATTETDVFMPLAITYAHRLMRRQAELRHTKQLAWLRPDAKAQLSFEFDHQGQPRRLDSVVLSTQHAPELQLEELEQQIEHELIRAVLPAEFFDARTKLHINYAGKFTVGGPHADCGLTGRKIIVDTYGGAAPHGGGAFSGKDPSKVDRSGAYAARYVAKNLVAAGLAQKCELQISYVIGREEPTSISVQTFGTGELPDFELEKLVRRNFDLRPRGIIEMLGLTRPIYQPTAVYGHFGRNESTFSWEQTDKIQYLKQAAGT